MTTEAERDERPARYVQDDGLVVYRASSIGGCPRALLATALGYPGRPWSEWFQEVLDEGTRMESRIESLYELRTGSKTVGQQREFDLPIVAGVVVRCHVDGESEYAVEPQGFDGGPGRQAVREFKKLRAGGWSDFQRRGIEMHPHWVWQLAVIQHSTQRSHAGVQLVGGKYNEDFDAIEDVHHFWYPNDQPVLPLKAIKRKVLLIETALLNGVMPQDVACEPKMWPCPFEALHDEQPDKTKLDDLPAADEWRTKVMALKALKARQHEIDNASQAVKLERDRLRDELIEMAARDGVAGQADESWDFTLDGEKVSLQYTKGSTFTSTRKPTRTVALAPNRKKKEQS